jgi:uncharacterized RDD family membrane protein YckC
VLWDRTQVLTPPPDRKHETLAATWPGQIGQPFTMKVLSFIFFNPLTRAYLTNDTILSFNSNKRFLAMGLELLYFLSVFIPLMLPFFIWDQMNQDIHVGQLITNDLKTSDLITLIPTGFLYMGLFNKDFYSGQSVVHRLLGYQIVDNKTSRPADRLRCMLRNITAPLWMIEGIITLFSPNRRLGDIIAGTRIMDVDKSDPELILKEIHETKYNGFTVLTLILPTLIMWTLMALTEILW